MNTNKIDVTFMRLNKRMKNHSKLAAFMIYLLSSGLYRRLWLFTKSADHSSCEERARGLFYVM